MQLGAPRTRLLYALLVLGGFAALAPLAVGGDWPLRGVLVLGNPPDEPIWLPPLDTGGPWPLLPLAALPLAVPLLQRVLRGAEGAELVGVLAATGRLLAAYGLTLAAGLWIAAAVA